MQQYTYSIISQTVGCDPKVAGKLCQVGRQSLSGNIYFFVIYL